MRHAFPFLAGLLGSALAASEITVIDLATDSERITLVDREKGQYLGHVSTCLLDDGKTILTVYPKGHGRGAIIYKRSVNGGNSWGKRLPTPASWATSKEVPTLHRMTGSDGRKRIILWSGLYPARYAISEDEGRTWSELKKAGDGIQFQIVRSAEFSNLSDVGDRISAEAARTDQAEREDQVGQAGSSGDRGHVRGGDSPGDAVDNQAAGNSKRFLEILFR